jgi:cytochrome c biogenesis protein CcmG, thiol:disulfide interchange protein DsbE
MNRWWIVFIVVAGLGSGWLWASRVPLAAQAVNQSPEPAVGRLAPNFALDTLDGERFELRAVQGTPVVLNFWATWCGPCIREMPALEAAAQRYAGAVMIVGVDQGEPAEVVQRFVDEAGVTFTIPLDSEFEVAGQYNVIGMPTTYFIDGQGIIRYTWVGEMNSITLAEGIAKIWP